MHRILIVEDDQAILETVADLFEVNGYQVFLAKNGLEGYQKALRKKPDLIISDIMMPIMNGLQFLRKTRKNKETELIPFIFLTAKVMIQSKLAGLELGADDYLTKPFETKELFLKVNNLINRKEKMIAMLASTPEKVSGSSRDEHLIQQLKFFLEEHISNARLSIQEVASGVAVSSSTLQKRVKKATNKSVSQFIREYRLMRGRDLILLSNESLKEISRLSGFSSLSYFSSCYKEFFGNPPSHDF